MLLRLAACAFLAVLLFLLLQWLPTTQQAVSGQRVEAAASKEGVSIDLVEYFDVAEVSGEVTTLRFGNRQAWRYLASGWHLRERDANGKGFGWTDKRTAVVEVPRVSKEKLRVKLHLAPPNDAKGMFVQEVSLLWNDHLLGGHTFTNAEPAVVTCEVPAEIQHIGPNYMQVAPAYWIKEILTPGSVGYRTVGVRCSWVTFSTPDSEVPSPLQPATVENQAIVQAPGSVITYYFVLPKAASFRADGILRIPDGISLENARGRVAVTLLDQNGQERCLFKRTLQDLAQTPEFHVEHDLSELAQQEVALSLSFSLKSTAPVQEALASSLSLEWTNPRIEGIGVTLPDGNPRKKARHVREPYNVLVILFDALRADHTEPYGAANVQTPSISRLAKSGVTFLNARSNSSWTRTSVATLLTSLYPSVHRVFDRTDVLPEDLACLPGVLHEMGYTTTLIANIAQIAAQFGFGSGFDNVHEYFRIHKKIRVTHNTPEQQAEFVWNKYIHPTIASSGDQPFFIYLHEIDPHAPYQPLPPYDKLYDFGYGGVYRANSPGLNIISKKMTKAEPQDIQYLNSLYRGEISFMDRYLGWMLDRLQEKGLASKTLVLFIADHGEEFMEHGELQHERHLFEEVLLVPMIWSLEGVIPADQRSQARVELIDVAPTIIDLVGGAIPEGMQGRNLLPHLLDSKSAVRDRAMFAQRWEDFSAVEFGNWKLIEAPKHRGSSSFMLFNLEEDPQELVNRWPREFVVAKTLQQMLKWRHHKDSKVEVKRPAQVPETEIDEEINQNLKALGYL